MEFRLSLLLSLLLSFNSYALDKSDFKLIGAKVQKPIPQLIQKSKVNKPYFSPPGYHRHMDSKGNVWEHRDNSSGRYDHFSPITGEKVLQKYFGPKPPTPIK